MISRELIEELAYSRCALELSLLIEDARIYAAWHHPAVLWALIGRISRLGNEGAHLYDGRAIAGGAHAGST
jgi:hypothetical protein